MNDLGVEHVIFMPTPNDGIRPNQELGVIKRKRIKGFRQMLATLNSQAAQFIAFENAERIFYSSE
jgi:hypothetical protein